MEGEELPGSFINSRRVSTGNNGYVSSTTRMVKEHSIYEEDQQRGRNLAKLPHSFAEALRSGYRVIDEASLETQKGKRVGILYLKNSSRPELMIAYEADACNGYRFSRPQVVLLI